jgi:hypothetical protein
MNGVTSERRRVAKVFESLLAISALAVHAADPGHTHARSERKFRSLSAGDSAHNLVPGNKILNAGRKLAFNDV